MKLAGSTGLEPAASGVTGRRQRQHIAADPGKSGSALPPDRGRCRSWTPVPERLANSCESSFRQVAPHDAPRSYSSHCRLRRFPVDSDRHLRRKTGGSPGHLGCPVTFNDESVERGRRRSTVNVDERRSSSSVSKREIAAGVVRNLCDNGTLDLAKNERIGGRVVVDSRCGALL